jgi:hypothetical protein
MAEDYGPRKFVILAMNAYDSQATVQIYQDLYPDVLMLMDPGWAIYDIYMQNNYIPLNYVITPEQTVDYFEEGFNEAIVRSHIENLLPEVTVVLTPDVVTVPQGGTLSFDVDLVNWENSAQSFYALTEVELPNSMTVTMMGPVPLTMNGNAQISTSLQHNIPVGTPLGTYTYTAKLGTGPPVDLMDISSFTFEVVAP